MPQINVDKEPGYYGGAIDVTVTFGPNSRRAIITQDDRVPVLSEVLAYDRGPLSSGLPVVPEPPNSGYVDRPFMAVTQDGKGNVFYDGGFPKFYNVMLKVGGNWPTQLPTQFSQLTAASKYLHNAMKFISNKTAVAAGNKKILIVGNAIVSEAYPLKASHYQPVSGQGGVNGDNGFKDVFDAVSAIAGFVPTYYDRADAPGGVIDLTYAYLSQFVAVIFLGSIETWAAKSFVSPRFASELAYYRTQGNGVGIITDHNGDFFTDMQTAVTNSSVFCYDPNQLAQHFGTYYSGNVDRNPKRVGEIRTELGGDHPLLANLGDDEYIFAGGSESLVMVETFAGNQVPVNQPKVFNLTTPGTHRINVLVQDNDGSISVRPYRYDLIDPSNIHIYDDRSRFVGPTLSTVKRSFNLGVELTQTDPPTMSGYVIRNNERLGTFQRVGNTLSVKYCSGSKGGFGFQSTDVVGYEIQQPFMYKIVTTVTVGDQTELNKQWTQPSQLGKLLAAVPDYSGMKNTESLRAFWTYANIHYRDWPDTPGNVFGIWPRVLSRCKRALAGPLSMCNLWVAPTEADWTSNKPANPIEADTAVIAATGDVYTWWITDGVGAWKKATEKAGGQFGVGRAVNDTRGTGLYVIQANQLVKA